MATPYSVPRYISLPQTLSFVNDPVKALMTYHERYGQSFYLYVGGIKKMLLTTEPGLIQHVLQRGHRKWEKSELQTDQVAKYLGRGLLTNTGTDWLKQRRLIQPGFHRQRLATLVQLMQEVVTQRADSLANEAQKTEEPIDIYPHCLGTAFQVIARTLYTDDMDTEQLAWLSETITKLQSYLILEVRLPFLHWWFKLTGKQQKHVKLAKDTIQLQSDLLHQRRAEGIQRDDLLQMLMDSRYEDTGEPMHDQQLIEEAVILFVAGHETSANALAWTFHLLSQNPQAVQKLRAELDAISPGRAPNFEELRQLPYLSQVLEESMRLYPPAWITDRKALEDDVYEGIKLSKDTIVSPFIYGVHHDPRWWPKPNTFDPDRFVPELKKNRPAFSYLPFGGGPRYCIGQSFAMLEMQLVLAEWVRRFDFVATGTEIKAEPLVTLRPASGIPMYIQPL